MNKLIIRRIYSTITYGPSFGINNFHIPRCVDCVNFKCKNTCAKYKCKTWIARADSTKCGIFANGFEYKL
jgi:hypothetical protein